MKKILILCYLLILLCTNGAWAQTIVYDNITPSNMKTIRITDDINIEFLNEYSYDIYINDSYIGSYKKDELILIPDNSNISIFIPKKFDTNLNNQYSIFKTYSGIILITLSGFIIVIIIGIIILRRIFRRR